MAARFTTAGPWWRSDVVGNEGESGVDLRGEGEAQGPRSRVGASGRRDRGGAASASLSPRLVAGEGGSAGTRPVPTRVGGTGEGDAVRELGRLGRQAGCGPGGLGGGRAGGLGCLVQGASPLFLFFCNFFLLFIFPFCFI